MKLNRVKVRSVLGVLLFTISTLTLADWNPQPNWKDSYSVDGVCYCDSTNYDHNLSSKSADTPIGPKNVVQICNDIRRKLGTGSAQGRIPYNDIQCGHGPANDAGDETGCPGRVDIGAKGCNIKGPRWNLEAVYGVASEPTPKPVVITTPQASVPSASNESCAIVTPEGMSLTSAKLQFIAACPGLQRRDCDPISGNRWMCSTGNIPSSFVAAPATSQPSPEPSKPAEPSVTIASVQTAGVSASNESCAIVTPEGMSLIAAKLRFIVACPGLKRQDCDPVSGNRWMCSTDNIPSNFVAAPATAQPSPEPLKPAEPSVTIASVQTTGVCEAQGSSLGAAREAFALSCPNIPRKDCDPTGNGQWTCSSGVIGSAAPGYSAGGGITTPISTQTVLTPTSTSTPASTPTATSSTTSANVGKVGSNDLVALHYDNCPDRDDGHAMAAGKAVVVRSGLQNVLVVNGTCGDSIRNSYQRSSEDVARAVWGSQWLDSYNDLNASEQTSAQRWVSVLANGGDVWVAEGGPSDFTARVLRNIASQYPTLNLKKVHVVQHSFGGGFNEANSNPSNMVFIKREADYIGIANGNSGANNSSNLNQNSSFFVATARQSEFSNEWNAAFNYMDPNRRLDFSDTVELLYLIDDTRTKTVDDFARNYLR